MARTPPGRDLSIDTVRGLCIVSMTGSHLANGSILDRITHPSAWVDGASGFVLLSGLLVGMVQRRTGERDGARAGRVKLLRRVRLIYVGHLFLALVALGTAAVDPVGAERLPSPADQGGWGWAVLRALTLRINPYFASILSLYVVVMLLSLITVELLRRRKVVVAASYALVVYAVGVVRPEWTQLPREAGVSLTLSWGAWFGLFSLGLIGGWYWRHGVAAALERRGVQAAAVGALGVALVAPVLLEGRLPEWAVDKDLMGPVRLVLSVGFYAGGYLVLRSLQRAEVVDRVLSPLTLLGQRSLDSYLVLSTLVLVLPSLVEYEGWSRTAVALGLASLLVCLAWAVLRRWRDPMRILVLPRSRSERVPV